MRERVLGGKLLLGKNQDVNFRDFKDATLRGNSVLGTTDYSEGTRIVRELDVFVSNIKCICYVY